MCVSISLTDTGDVEFVVEDEGHHCCGSSVHFLLQHTQPLRQLLALRGQLVEESALWRGGEKKKEKGSKKEVYKNKRGQNHTSAN